MATPSYNVSSLRRDVARQMRVNQTSAGVAVDAVFTCIKDALKEGQNVNLRGFGTFKLRTREARTGLNPRTQERIQIPSRRSVAFTPSSLLRKVLNGDD